jgi:hypothetical protein
MGNTVISGVNAPTSIPYETGTVAVSGTVTAIGNVPFPPDLKPVVTVSLKTPCCPQELASSTVNPTGGGTNTLTFSDVTLTPSTTLAPGDYEIEINFAGAAGFEPARYSQQISVIDVPAPGETPVVPRPTSCMPCSDPIETVKRVIRDRTVSAAVGELLQGVADKGVAGALQEQAGPLVQTALTTLSKAFAGTDAVRAKGECCKAEILLQVAVESVAPLKALEPGKAKLIQALAKAQAADATGTPLQIELIKPELLRLIKPQVINHYTGDLAATNVAYTPEGILISDVDVPESGRVIIAFPEELAEGVGGLSREYYSTQPGGSEFTHYTNVGPTRYWNMISREQASRGEVQTKGSASQSRKDAKDAAENVAKKKDTAPEAVAKNERPYFELRAQSGSLTTAICILKSPAAQVRCFSLLEDKGCGCLPGKQFISCVAVSVWQDGKSVDCSPTGNGGCIGFQLNPGWYSFSAPECVTIEGCNYTLASNSPVSAFLGAGQCCSDIFFRYKKKGNEMQVISKVCYPDSSNPYVEAFNNFAGMQYLLVSDSDPTFVPLQQTTADGSAFCYRNLPAGSYSLYCQAPPTFGAQPVQPVCPKDGRLSLTVFGGQTTPVPVEVKFRTCTTAPAVLNGVVRDEYGSAIPGQLVKFLDGQGRVKGAAVTNAQGVYTFQMYTAEDVTIVFGAQQFAVSKAQIQAAMKTVGTPALPSPDATMEGTVQRAELMAGFGD